MSSTDIQKTISQFIESQFPKLYREQEGVELTENQRSVLIDFVESYFKWLESEKTSFLRSREMFTYRDIDTTLDEFILYFRKKYLSGINYSTTVDERFLIKNIIDLYRSKGSELSIRLLFKLLFNEEAKVYFPGQDVLRPSDSRWIEPIYIEAISSSKSINLINKRVYGSKSNATAFIEDVVTKRVQNRLIDILYLSDVQGTFVTGDIVTFDGILSNGVKVVGSLSDIILNNNTIGDNKIGDQFDISSFYGVNGKVKVTGIKSKDGAVTFTLNDGGFGYTTDNNTIIYISDLIILLPNSNTIFELDDIVTQKIERIYLQNGNLFISTANVGDTIYGIDSSNNIVANAQIINITTETIGTNIFNVIDVQVEENTFLQNQILTFTANTELIVGNKIFEERTIEFSIENANGLFSNGETVYQRDLSETSNNISDRYAFGIVSSANDSYLEITNSFGTFIVNDIIVGYDSGASADVANIISESIYANGIITEKISNTEYRVIYQTLPFSSNITIQQEGSNVLANIDSTINESSISIRNIDGDEVSVNTVANTYFNGIVIGQNSSSIGISSITNEFLYAQNISKLINQNDDSIIVSNIGFGSDAQFEIGSIINSEIVSIAQEKINSKNIKNINYPLIYINGTGSGVGYINNITIYDGGAGYTNSSTVTFVGGGYGGQNPIISARANVLTNSNSEIISIDIIEPGEGYFESPSIVISDGSDANLEINMIFGYGFPKEPFANLNTTIIDALQFANVEIGEIGSLDNIFSGFEYTNTPIVRILNSSINSFNKKDQTLNISIVSGSQFIIGEIITQANTGAKGKVKSYSNNVLKVKDISFSENFTLDGGIITGSNSSTTATINNIEIDILSNNMGNNAIVSASVIEQAGIIDSLSIINSGYGYLNGETVNLINGDKILTGVINVQRQGISPGYWKTRTSHLNSEKKIHDNNYYQEYSYDIQSPINIDEYRDTILELLHLAGTKLFGTVIKTSEKQITPTVESYITSI